MHLISLLDGWCPRDKMSTNGQQKKDKRTNKQWSTEHCTENLRFVFGFVTGFSKHELYNECSYATDIYCWKLLVSLILFFIHWRLGNNYKFQRNKYDCMLLLYYVKAMEMTKLFITIDFKINGLLKESPRTIVSGSYQTINSRSISVLVLYLFISD